MYYNVKVIYEDTFGVPLIQKAYKSYIYIYIYTYIYCIYFFFFENLKMLNFSVMGRFRG